MVEESAAASRSLLGEAANLANMVARFRGQSAAGSRAAAPAPAERWQAAPRPAPRAASAQRAAPAPAPIRTPAPSHSNLALDLSEDNWSEF